MDSHLFKSVALSTALLSFRDVKEKDKNHEVLKKEIDNLKEMIAKISSGKSRKKLQKRFTKKLRK